MRKPSLLDLDFDTRLSFRRTGLASLLFAVRRPGDAKAATVDANAVRLVFGSRSTAIPLGDIESAVVETGRLWATMRLRHAAGKAIVSGLSQKDAKAFAEALEAGRTHWWRQAMAAQAATVRSAHDQLSQLADPPAYMAHNVFSELRRNVEKAAGQFAARWPSTLSDTPEFRMLRAMLEFLEAPDRFRVKANASFVANELFRSRAFFDRIETRPLTDEQRRAVVVDEGRNLVVAAAGSGKTSVIVAKTGWLLHRGYRRPSELLLLAFAKNARNEMEERIRKRLGNETARGIAVQTFHGLGMAIIGEAEGRRPALAKAAEDDKALFDLLKAIVDDLAAERMFWGLLLKWFQARFAPYRSQHEFQTWGEYWNYIRRYEIRSLKGDRVKSYEECEIANFLYLNGISYEYERIYEHDTATPQKRPYQPDFYLTDAGIYIEHFGLDASGNTAPSVDREEYRQSMEWKRQLHKKHGTTLIETFSHESAAGTLLDNLTARLRAHGVTLSPIPPSEAFAVLEQQGRIEPFIRLLATFLQHYKGSRLKLAEVAGRAASIPDRLRAEAFLAVFRPVFERYEETLPRSGQIDFHDMINKAADHVESGRYRSPFGYILVDEFQDISPGRARLLKALLDQSPTTRLFAVGDDWQAIYRFGGSDIAVMRGFEERFGNSERLDLETTFRCADRIAAVATDFILRNPAQIPKNVRSGHRAAGPCVHVGLPGEKRLPLLRKALDRIAAAAERHGGTSTVLLLGRFNHTRPRNWSTLARQYPGLRLAYRTVHAAKGLEADYVVVLDLSSGKYGFPVEIADDPVLDLVLAAPENYPNAEERRLLYVAITRARREVYLLADGDPPSPFVLELIGGGYDVAVFGSSPERDIPCPECVEGRLKRRKNARDSGIFYGCSNWPYCEHTQRPCPACGTGLLARADDAFRCRDCGQSIAKCPECDGWLETRTGKFGRFLGCANYPACGYTRNTGRKRKQGRTAAGTAGSGQRRKGGSRRA